MCNLFVTWKLLNRISPFFVYNYLQYFPANSASKASKANYLISCCHLNHKTSIICFLSLDFTAVNNFGKTLPIYYWNDLNLLSNMKETSKTLVVCYEGDPCFLNWRLYSIIEIKCTNYWHGVSKIGYSEIESKNKKFI